MKKNKIIILVNLTICLLQFSCDSSVNDQTVAATTLEKSTFGDDYFIDNATNKPITNNDFPKLVAKSTNLASKDSDGDGLSDFAEDKLGLNKTDVNDVKKFTAFSFIGIPLIDGRKEWIPFYQTSYYQNHFCNPPEPTFNTTELSVFQIQKIKDYYPSWLKILRTSEFQNYILSKPAGKTQGLIFIEKAKNLTRGVEFQSKPSNPGVLGSSNMWSLINVVQWSLSLNLGHQYSINGVIPHEFIHHLGYSHDYDYAYGGGYKARDMFNENKHLYPVYDLENPNTYTISLPEPDKAVNGPRSSSSVFLLNVAFSKPNSIILNNNSASGSFISSNQLLFSRGASYTLSIDLKYYRQIVTVWIDFNNDSEYNDNEKIINNVWCDPGRTNIINFNIPLDAYGGRHSMRLNASRNNPSAYGPNDYGTSIDFLKLQIN